MAVVGQTGLQTQTMTCSLSWWPWTKGSAGHILDEPGKADPPNDTHPHIFSSVKMLWESAQRVLRS